MNEPETDDLWDPRTAGDEQLLQLEATLRVLRAPMQAVDLELPARAAPRALPERPALRRPLALALLTLAAGLALWFTWRGRSTPPSPELLARAPQADPGAAGADLGWQLEQLDGDAHCREEGETKLERGAPLPEGALDTGESAFARLSRGAAQLELHPSSSLSNTEGALVLVRGRAWVDLPLLDSPEPWRFGVGPLRLETQSARFMASFQPDTGFELELVGGALVIIEGEREIPVAAGQLCRAQAYPGPVEAVDAIECETTSTKPLPTD